MISAIVTAECRLLSPVLTWFGGQADIQLHKESSSEPDVVYWFIDTDFGQCLVAAAGERLCYLGFVDSLRREAVSGLRRKWSGAEAGRAW